MDAPHRPTSDASPCQPVDPDLAVVLLLTTFPDHRLATQAAHHWVESGLAACVHIAAAGQSVYGWNGGLETAQEVTLTAKTTAACAGALQEALQRDHPYDLPEVLVVRTDGGSAAYLDWVRGICRPASRSGAAVSPASGS
jgi:periplasmic divalent cation tolerance protein